MDSLTAELTTWLLGQFAPSVIVLAGSRATGQATPASDWDVFLLTDAGRARHRQALRWHGQHLDLEHVPWSCLPDGILRIHYGPLPQLTILWDDAHGRGQALATATATAYAAGPPPPDAGLLDDLHRLLTKITAQLDEPLTAQLYIIGFVPALLAAWFSVHGRWSLPPKHAVPAIRTADPHFARVLLQISMAPHLAERYAGCQIAAALLAERIPAPLLRSTRTSSHDRANAADTHAPQANRRGCW